jgi:FlaA1/EpsC-like NDP-sugar epimerase
MVDTFLASLFGLSRLQKRLAQALADAASLLIAFLLAMALRLESLQFLTNPQIWLAAGLVILGSLAVFHRLRLYEAMVRFISANAIVAILLGVSCSALMLFAASLLVSPDIPQTVPVIYAAFALPLVSGSRFSVRALFNRRQNTHKENVFIYGAGSAGRQLLRSLQQDPGFNPIAFLDDSPQLQKVTVAGLRVFAPVGLRDLSQRYAARRVLLAIPSADAQTRRNILSRLGDQHMHVQSIPGIADIMSGKARIDDLRSVDVEDLLGRETVPPMVDLLDANLRGKSVMVTGAGGSIGSELCRQAIARGPRRLVLVETSEFALYSIDAELRRILGDRIQDLELIPLLLSVQSGNAMATTMRRFQIETVYHAAAYKHVPLVEHNIVESIRNNVFGTLHTALSAIQAGVESFILISTDKAVRPTNYMGASKRMAELICQALAQHQGTTRFAMVRFGNVLGSSGSVIPHFRRQIEMGGPVTVTHPKVTRYFMTIPEAALLVLQAGAMARGGDVFVLDMGDPIAIVDLAARMISLSGYTPCFPQSGKVQARPGEIAIKFTKLRPGEKLYEELLIGTDTTQTKHPRIMSAHEEQMPWPALQTILAGLEIACNQRNLPMLRDLLISAPTGFVPSADGVDHDWSLHEDTSDPITLYPQQMSAAE